MRNTHIILIITLFATLLAPLWSQEKKPQDIEFSADRADYDEDNQRIRLVGKVIITSDKMKLTSPTAVYFTEKQYAEFLGGVKMVGEQSTATAKELKVWYGETRAKLSGDVRLISQNSDGENKEPTVILSETLDYNWVKEEGVANGSVKMRQGQKRAFADRAEIYQKRNEILLIGNVRVEQGDGDWLTASRAIYDTEKQTVRAEGRVVAKTRLEQKEEPASEGTTAVPAKESLPEPLIIEPSFELVPLRRLPSTPLPWLKEEAEG